MRAPKNWKITRQYRGHVEFTNKKSGIALSYHHNENNLYVSILGGRRYQPEYLVGGNSRRHDVPASTAKEYDFIITRAPEAKEIALRWMKDHPDG